MDIELRNNKPPEQIEFTAHSGTCHHCGGLVKMKRDRETMVLKLDGCWCLQCGQPYFVKLKPNQTIEDFEHEQWRQKGQKFAMGGD